MNIVKPPSGSTTAKHVVRIDSKKIADVAYGTTAKKNVFHLDPWTDFDTISNNLAYSYEYFRIAQLVFVIHFIGNWLIPKSAVAVAYISDPKIPEDGPIGSNRQETMQIFRVKGNHVYDVPNTKRWLYCKEGYDNRLSSDGKVVFWTRPYMNQVLTPASEWSVSVFAVLEFARKTLIQNVSVIKTFLKDFGGIFEPLHASVVFPGGDTRSTSIVIKTNNDSPKPDAFGFIQFSFPIDFQFQVTDADLQKYIWVNARFTTGDFITIDGKIALVVKVNVGQQTDFENFNVATVKAPVPGDFPFRNSGYLIESFATKMPFMTSFVDTRLNRKQISYNK